MQTAIFQEESPDAGIETEPAGTEEQDNAANNPERKTKYKEPIVQKDVKSFLSGKIQIPLLSLFLKPYSMYSLFLKEIRSFLSSLIGYIVIIVFLLAISLFMWIIRGDSNVFDKGYANIDTLFAVAPWVFLFLIPAITMRSFADEKKSGTIELLLTRPLTDFQIIIAKYSAGFILVVFSLLPTLVYYYSVYRLGSPVGNIDSGGTWGSYVGLLLLGSSFVSIGIFASSLTDNQIISFILALAFCFFCYTGLEQISSLSLFGKADTIIQALGINEHYNSLSRGVIDTRDIVYFLSFNAIFILLTKTVLESRKW